jgi:2-oxoisovalerate dehydrogenase E2 component (dihydrolipoyl transacylase)
VSRYVFKLPDLGEGTVEAEIVGWHVKPGDVVAEDDVIVEVMTDKAAVEVPAPVAGKVISVTGSPGDMVPVGSELIVFETDTAAGGAAVDRTETVAGATSGSRTGGAPVVTSLPASHAPSNGRSSAGSGIAAGPASAGRTSIGSGVASGSASAGLTGVASESVAHTNGSGNGHAHGDRPGRVATSPAIRRRAREAGVDLTQLSGSGPNGRILRQDFEAFVSSRSGPKLVRSRPGEGTPGVSMPASSGGAAVAEPATEEIKVIGLRRLIAQRMSEAKRNIPHFAYVEELDVTELESLRGHLNGKLEQGQPALTYLPFIVTGLIRVLRDFPQCNAHYDAERGVIIRHRAVHVGVATQTPDGLKVPVVRNAQALSLWDLASEIRRVTEAARTNKASREELSGSTITVTSLGKLGGIASTPIINQPEVGIIGVNRAVERPVVYGGAITIRRMMNLSSSFDHRFVDGHDAAAMIQALKERIEHPAMLFMD